VVSGNALNPAEMQSVLSDEMELIQDIFPLLSNYFPFGSGR
jgi:hypothetical protein